MKKALLTTLACSVAIGTFAQGTLLVGNHFGFRFRAPIYGPELPFTTGPKSGQSAIGTPAGSTAYTGALLQGTGYTFAVYSGAANVTDPNQLTLLVSTTFRTAAANQLPAGLVFFREPVVPGVAPGEQARLEVRAWDNEGGTLTTWEMVTNSTTAAFNRSGMFLSAPLGGGLEFSPEMSGWSSFSLAVIPEPSRLLLAGLGAVVFGLLRWRRSSSATTRPGKMINGFLPGCLVLLAAIGAQAQGTLSVGNSVAGIFRAPIYNAPSYEPYLSMSGQSSLGIPSGPLVYPGALLQGSGYTFSVYYGAATVTDPSALRLLVSTPFGTATGNGLPAGLVQTIPDVALPGIPPGGRAMLQVRVWYNAGGVIPSYPFSYSSGASAMFLSEPLGGLSVNGPLLPPDMIGWSSFNIYPFVPEPSPLLLAGLCAVVFGLFRWRRPGRTTVRPRKSIIGFLPGCLVLLAAIGAQAQGTINIVNTLGTIFRAPIYGLNPGNPLESLYGQSPLGVPSGPTVYAGPLLQGTGYSFGVYYGAATVTDPSALSLLVSTTFRTAVGNVLPAGLIFQMPDFVVPGIAPGERAMLQVRAWDNGFGAISSFEDAVVGGASAMFLSEPLGGFGVNGLFLSPDLTGWSSFNLNGIIPEPSPLLLAGLGALVFGIFGWRRKTAQGSR